MKGIEENYSGIKLVIPDNVTDEEVSKLIDDYVHKIIGDFDTPVKHEDN